MTSNPLPPDLADAIARARPRLGPLASRVLFFESIGSTNDEAAKPLSAGPQTPADGPNPPDGFVVVADAQTAGRGRRGHTWFSPPGSGLYVSVVLTPSRAREDAARATLLLTLMTGVAIAEGIERATGLRVDLKWPNDLQIARRKLGGILAEASGGTTRGVPEAVVVGYGLNVAATAFPPELRDRATSLESELGRTVDRRHVLVETLCALAARYADLLDARYDAILDAWRALAPGASGARVTWTTLSGELRGITGGVDDRGALLVTVGDRVERIVSGEVKWL